MIRSSQVNLGRNGDVGFFSFGKNLSAKICNLKNNNSKGCYFFHGHSLKIPPKSGIKFTLRASYSVRSEATVNSKKASRITRTKPVSSFLCSSFPLMYL